MIISENIPELDISYKKKIKSNFLVKITSSKSANEVLRMLWSNKIELCEEFMLLLLNRNNKCLGWIKVSQGSIEGTVVDIKIILAIAIKAFASAIIVGHNHPSGNLNPSSSDITLTKRLKECCKLFEIKLLDHIILSGDIDQYFSMSDEGII